MKPKKQQSVEELLVPDTMKIPLEIEIKQSEAESTKLGAWCKKQLKKGQKFGPFAGKISRDVTDDMDGNFVWEIVDQKTKEFLFYIDATDARRANWMRYVNCARYFEEQNLISAQEGTDIFYTTIKDVEIGEELLTWYARPDLRKKKRNSLKENNYELKECPEKESIIVSPSLANQNGRRSKSLAASMPDSNVEIINKASSRSTTSDSFGNALLLSISDTLKVEVSREHANDSNEIKQKGAQKNTLTGAHVKNYRRAKAAHKFRLGESPVSSIEARQMKRAVKAQPNRQNRQLVQRNVDPKSSSSGSSVAKYFRLKHKLRNNKTNGAREVMKSKPRAINNDQVSNSVQEINDRSLNGDNNTKYFQFEMTRDNIVDVSEGTKLYRCNICTGVYRHIFSLKRHFIRDHVNEKYVTPLDRHNCVNNRAAGKAIEKNDNELVRPEDKINVKCEIVENDNAKGKDLSNLFVTVNVSPAGRVSDRKVENRLDSTADQSEIRSAIKKAGPNTDITSKLKIKAINRCGKSKYLAGKHSIDDVPLTTLGNSGNDGNLSSALDLFRCHLCLRMFDKASVLKDHISVHLSESNTRTHSLSTADKKTNHSDHVKNNQPKKADIGPLAAGDKEALDSEALSATSNRFVCKSCNTEFTARFSLNRHIARKSCKLNAVVKTVTIRRQRTFPILSPHRRLPKQLHTTKDAPVPRVSKARCRYCHNVFGGGRQLKVHRRKAHPEHYFECSRCGRYFHEQSQLAEHVKTLHESGSTVESSTVKIPMLEKEVIVASTVPSKETAKEFFKTEVGKNVTSAINPAMLSPIEANPICTTCDRRFASYAKYVGHCELFHRRQMVADGSRKTLLAKLSQYKAANARRSLDLSAEMEINYNERFYANVARKIRDNLANFVAGKAGELNANVDTGKKPRRVPNADILKTIEKSKAFVETIPQPAINLSLYNLPDHYIPFGPDKLLCFEKKTSGIASPAEIPEADVKAQNTEEVGLISIDESCTVEQQVNEKTVNCESEPIYPCTKCKRKFGTFVMYQEHMQLRHGIGVCRTKQLMFDCANTPTLSAVTVAEKNDLEKGNTNNNSLTLSEKNCGKLADSEANLAVVQSFRAMQLNLNSVMSKDLTVQTKLSTIDPLTILVSPSETSIRSESSPQLTTRPSRQSHSPAHGPLLQVNAPLTNHELPSPSLKLTRLSPVAVQAASVCYVCSFCHMQLSSVKECDRHEQAVHPLVECMCVDLSSTSLVVSPKSVPNYVGLLQVSSSILPYLPESKKMLKRCTKCQSTKESISELHEHVLECADPLPVRYYYTFALPSYACRQAPNGKFQKRRVLYRSTTKFFRAMSTTSDSSSRPGSDVKRKEKGYREPIKLPYNLRNQLQNCDAPLSSAGKLKCEGCGSLHDTISNLERHIPMCLEKEKIREIANLERQNSTGEDREYDPSKHMCIYCLRQFTYLRLLVRHLTESCHVKKKLISAGEYIDREWEADVVDLFEKQKCARESAQAKVADSFNEKTGFDREVTRTSRRQHRGLWWGSRRRTPIKKKILEQGLCADENSSCSSVSTWSGKEHSSRTVEKFYESSCRVLKTEDENSHDQVSKRKKCVHDETLTASPILCKKKLDDALFFKTRGVQSSPDCNGTKQQNGEEKDKGDLVNDDLGRDGRKNEKRDRLLHSPLTRNQSRASTLNHTTTDAKSSCLHTPTDSLEKSRESGAIVQNGARLQNMEHCALKRNSSEKNTARNEIGKKGDGLATKANVSKTSKARSKSCESGDKATNKRRGEKHRQSVGDTLLNRCNSPSPKRSRFAATYGASLLRRSFKMTMMSRQANAALFARMAEQSSETQQ